MSNKSFLKDVESLTGKGPSQIYNELGWSRQRYHQQRELGTFPPKEYKNLRLAIDWTIPKFYKFVGKFYEE